MKLSFALPSKNAKPPAPAPSLKAPSAFATAEDDTTDAAPTALLETAGRAPANKQLLAQNVQSTSSTPKAMKKRMEAEQKVDATVYEYDEVWDRMQEAKARKKAEKEAESQIRQPKHIGNLLKAAQTRKLDYLRAEEKMMQREREREGDEFADRDQFVTQAYKDQMEEVRRAEEEERQREELEKKRGKSAGLTHLYAQLLNDSESRHQEAVAATTAPQPTDDDDEPDPDPRRRTGMKRGPAPNLTIVKPPDSELPEAKSDLELAMIARGQGKAVELNDDNQIVDKRELLSAGLNLSGANTRKLGLVKGKNKAGDGEQVNAHRAVGSAASRREIDERRRREIVKQLEEEDVRTKEQREREEREATERVVAKRNNAEDVSSARERYLARKKRKVEEEAAAATATAEGQSADADADGLS